MKAKRIATYTIALLLTITIIASGCSTPHKPAKSSTPKTPAISKGDFDAKIAKTLPSAVQVAGSSTPGAPLSFHTLVDGVIYYIADGDLFLNTPILKGDTIKLNYWSNPTLPNTKITINAKIVYYNPTARHRDNRFYFYPTKTPQDIKPE
jgi:hypothetical protein